MERLTSEKQVFIEKFTIFGRGIGLPQSVSKVLGLLIICTPKEVSATQAQEMLALSTGSVSTALAMLVDMQLAERVRIAKQRTPYYRLVPGGFIASVKRRFETFRLAEEIADYGLHIAPDDERLLVMKKLYAFLDDEMKEVSKRLDKLA